MVVCRVFLVEWWWDRSSAIIIGYQLPQFSWRWLGHAGTVYDAEISVDCWSPIRSMDGMNAGIGRLGCLGGGGSTTVVAIDTKCYLQVYWTAGGYSHITRRSISLDSALERSVVALVHGLLDRLLMVMNHGSGCAKPWLLIRVKQCIYPEPTLGPVVVFVTVCYW